MSRFLTTNLLLVFAVGLAISLPISNPWTRIGALTAIWIVYGVVVGLGSAFIQLQFYGPVICRGRPDPHRVALTFDDGPDPHVTPRLLELLQREHVPAAFFCVGKNVDANPQIVARMRDEGHLVGNHTYDHHWYTGFYLRQAWSTQITRAQDAISRATGTTPRYMRPPMGVTNPHLMAPIRKAGLKIVGWDVRSLDRGSSSRQIVDRVLAGTRDGSIILLHDGGLDPDRVLENVEAVIKALRAKGFEFERLDRLIEPKN